MAQIGAELDHFPIGIEALSIPVHNRADGKRVPQVMDAWPTPMFAEALCLTQADPLGDACEVEARTTIRHPAAVIALKKGPWSSPEKPYSLGVIYVETFDSARGNRHKTRLAVLAAPYRNHSRIEIDVAIVELQRHVEAQAGDSDQPE
jgi:hypothetical protein